MDRVGIVDVGSYLPGRPINADTLLGHELANKGLASSPLLGPPATRHHVDRDETAGTMVEKAARPMFKRLGIDPAVSVDLVITNVLLPDNPITGCGAEIAQRLGLQTEWIIDLHNGGCGSFPYMLKLAQTIVDSGGAKTALLCNVQNTAGRVFSQPEVRTRSHAVIAGDGAGVAYLKVSGDSPVLAVETRHRPEAVSDMGLALEDGRKYWEPGSSEIDISFNKKNLGAILERGNTIVPEVVRAVCARIDVTPEDIDILVTNQGNRVFLRNWRRALGINEGRHIDTFDRFGNLYGAGVPITLAQASRDGRLPDNALLVVAGFAHAGDFAAAAAVRWKASARCRAR